MSQGFVFSWAENKDGRMVHVDDVPRGIDCGCICPNCQEVLLARKGEVREHHFAHHSEDRGANLKICYMVTLYKLAEQIIKKKKRLHAPSYYGIFKDKDLIFQTVEIDNHFEREDKQPDVIATTEDGQQYLIEFIFQWKVQHKQAIDYKNLNCIEIDLSNQTLESVESFLLNSSDNKKWLNCETYFNLIEPTYASRQKYITIKPESECEQCSFNSITCCAVKQKGYSDNPIIIENGGKSYRLCKTELYNTIVEQEKREYLMIQQMRENVERELREERNRGVTPTPVYSNVPPSERSCLNCVNNLSWDNHDGLASCGVYISLRIPKRNKPQIGKFCKRWVNK